MDSHPNNAGAEDTHKMITKAVFCDGGRGSGGED